MVCLTFLAGNDFIPHVPSLDIYDRPSALDTLLNVYKDMLKGGGGGAAAGGYLSDSGRFDHNRLCWFFTRLAELEENTFQQREVRGGMKGRKEVAELDFVLCLKKHPSSNSPSPPPAWLCRWRSCAGCESSAGVHSRRCRQADQGRATGGAARAEVVGVPAGWAAAAS